MEPIYVRRKDMAAENILQNFANCTTLHGAPRIIRAKKWYVSLFWVMIFLSAMTMFGFQFSQLLVKYYKYEKQISIEIRQHNESTLPWITICAPQTFDSLVLRQIYDLFSFNTTHRNRVVQKTNNRFIKFFNAYYNHVLVNDKFASLDFFYEVLYSLDQSIIEEGLVQYDHFVTSFNVDTYRIVKKRYFPYPCFTLQFKKHLTYGAKPYAFELMIIGGNRLKPNETERRKVPVIIEQILEKYIKKSNVFVRIHPPNTEIIADLTGHYYTIFPKEYVQFIISARKTERLGYPYGNCSHTYPFRYHPKGIYTQSACSLWFLLGKLVDECGCKNGFIKYMDESNQMNDISACESSYSKLFEQTNITERDVEIVFEHYIHNQTCSVKMSDLPKDTNDICPRACNEYKFDEKKITLHDTDDWLGGYIHGYIDHLIRSNQTERLKLYGVSVETMVPAEDSTSFSEDLTPVNNNSVKKIAEETLILQFEMEEDDMTVTEENPAYTFVQLLSDIGGQLGLWIGMSIITVFELFDLFYRLIKIMWDKCTITKRHYSIDFGLPAHTVTSLAHSSKKLNRQSISPS